MLYCSSIELILFAKVNFKTIYTSVKNFLKDSIYIAIYGDANFFETTIGIKHRKIRFNSDRFSQYVCKSDILNKESVTKLVLPPDGLKNKYTWSNNNIYNSPHFQLMKDIDNSNLESSQYITFYKNGILDSRSPAEVNTGRILKVYEKRKKSLFEGSIFDIYVLPTKRGDKLVITDGKHKLALATYFNKFSQIRLNYVSTEYHKDIYFRKFYSKILAKSDELYSINKRLVENIYE